MTGEAGRAILRSRSNDLLLCGGRGEPRRRILQVWGRRSYGEANELRAVPHRVLPLLAITLLACAPDGEPIIVGVAGPFSQARGESMRLAAELAMSEINARGGVQGRPVALVFRDDSARAEVAVRVAEELVEMPGLVAVVGHLNSSATLAAAPIYNRDRNPVVEISPSASSPAVSAAGDYTFRICPDDGVHGARLALWAVDRLGLQSAAVIYQNDDYGRGVRTTFTQSFTALGGVVVAADPYVDELTTFEPYLRRVQRRGGSDGLMIAGTRTGAERILITLDSLSLDPIIFGGDGLTGLEASEVIDPEGAFISSAYLPDRLGPRNQEFVAAYRDAYGNRLPDHRGAGAYDIVHLLARAVEAVGTDRRAIREYLAGVGSRTPPFDGVTGAIAFDERGDVPDKEVVIGVVRNRRLVTAGQ